ncbi:MAG: hypothetical protein V3W04_13820 [Gammaproteobacteria bacterium]
MNKVWKLGRRISSQSPDLYVWYQIGLSDYDQVYINPNTQAVTDDQSCAKISNRQTAMEYAERSQAFFGDYACHLRLEVHMWACAKADEATKKQVVRDTAIVEYRLKTGKLFSPVQI